MKNWSLSFIILGLICQPLIPAYALDTQALSQLVGSKAVTFSDGVELIFTLMQIEKRYPDFEARKKFLMKTGIMPQKWNDYGATDPLVREDLAYMVVKMLGLKGGAKARLVGMNKRFSMEALIHEGIMREGHGMDLMTGTELVEVMAQAADFMLRRGEA